MATKTVGDSAVSEVPGRGDEPRRGEPRRGDLTAVRGAVTFVASFEMRSNFVGENEIFTLATAAAFDDDS